MGTSHPQLSLAGAELLGARYNGARRHIVGTKPTTRAVIFVCL